MQQGGKINVKATGTTTPRTLADWAEKEVLSYGTVASAKNDPKLEIGRRVRTACYSNIFDGGGGYYIVVAGDTGTVDDGSYHDMSNGLQLQLIPSEKINVRVFGAVGDGTTNDYPAFNNAFNYAYNLQLNGVIKYCTIRVPDGDYSLESRIVSTTDTTNKDISITFEGDSTQGTNIIVNNPNGFLRWVKTNYGLFFSAKTLTILSGYATFSGATGLSSGNAIELQQATSGNRYYRHYHIHDVNIRSKSLTGFNDRFTKSIAITGGGRPLIENTYISSVYTVVRSDSWVGLVGIDLIDVYSPVVLNGNVWGNEFGIRYLNNNDPGAEAGTFRNLNLDADKGFTTSTPSVTGEPGLILDNVSTNCGNYSYSIRGRKFVKITNAWLYNETTSGSYTDIFLDNVDDVLISGITYTFNNLSNRTCVRIVDNSGDSKNIRIIENTFDCNGVAISTSATGVTNVQVSNPNYGSGITDQLVPNGNLNAFTSLVLYGTGSPEGVYDGPIGSLYRRVDGGAGTSLYVKEVGAGNNTGWVGK